MEKILYLQPLARDVLEGVRKYVPSGMTLDALEQGGEAELAAKVREASYIVVATTRIDQALLSQAPALRFIQHQGVGYDNINMADLRSADVPLALNTAGLSAVSEHAIMLMLATYRRLPHADQALRQGQWLQYELRAESRQLAGKCVGIIGLGRIGQSTAEKLRGFGVELCYYDKFRQPAAVEQRLGVAYLSFDELLAKADIVCLHLGLSAETRHLMGAREFGLMKPGAVLINTARGGLVDEAALVQALRSGRLSGAGLDVFDPEPIAPESELKRFSNVVLTPHISAGTREVFDEKMMFAFANIARFSQGEAVHCLVE